MRTISRDGEHETEIRKSRFLCAVARVDSEAAARAFIAERRRLHWDANHNCTAYVLGDNGDVQRSSDDGEPGGTAGVPMLEVLRHRGITNTAAVVTRYFGGVKLGAGGLIRAYGGAVAAAIDAVGVLERRTMLLVTVHAGHEQAGRIENALRGSRFAVRSVTYGDRVHIEVGVAEPDLADLTRSIAELSGGEADHEVTGTMITEVR
ncbi:putative YigZ family protein [Murinocardiopsis flavida]|uniref:Putative YigZ family protein n=1 Tax=Murinocardiopsis flavida TaxID=645275 RepID=A0A2P8DQR0_9ACTN|nr:YigZ family protein [Murinocardiopsis flavida]PSK99557.1 putative YigZ family protein [Murinocardiopsis flavida]